MLHGFLNIFKQYVDGFRFIKKILLITGSWRSIFWVLLKPYIVPVQMFNTLQQATRVLLCCRLTLKQLHIGLLFIKKPDSLRLSLKENYGVVHISDMVV